MKIIISLILFYPLFLIGQEMSPDFEVTSSNPFERINRVYTHTKKYISLKDGRTISIKTNDKLNSKKVSIQKFDAEGMKEIGRNEFDDFPKNSNIKEILKLEERLYAVFDSYSKKTKTYSVYSREINIEKMNFEKVNPLFTIKSSNKEMNFDINVITSVDEKNILIKSTYDQLGFYVFDNKLNQIWSKEVKVAESKSKIKSLASIITDSGTVLFLSRIYGSEDYYRLSTITNESIENQKLSLKEGLVISQVELIEAPDGKILVTGYYDIRLKGYRKRIDGLYFLELKNGTVLKEKMHPFSVDFMKTYLTKKQQRWIDSYERKKKSGINNLQLRDVTVNPDGSIIIVGEVFDNGSTVSVKHLDANNPLDFSSTSTAYAGNIIMSKISLGGDLVWQRKLPKNQLTGRLVAGKESLGISYIKTENKHCVLYLDSKENSTLEEGMTPKRYKVNKEGYLSAYIVDDVTGKVKKHLIADLTKIKGVKKDHELQVNSFFKILDKIFLLEIPTVKNQDMMIKLELK